MAQLELGELTSAEVAAQAGVSISTVRRWRRHTWEPGPGVPREAELFAPDAMPEQTAVDDLTVHQRRELARRLQAAGLSVKATAKVLGLKAVTVSGYHRRRRERAK